MEMTNEEKMCMQRAAIMGLLTAMLEDDQERTMKEIKDKILSCLNTIMDFDLIVGDFIDKNVFEAAERHCQEQIALDEVNEILNGN